MTLTLICGCKCQNGEGGKYQRVVSHTQSLSNRFSLHVYNWLHTIIHSSKHIFKVLVVYMFNITHNLVSGFIMFLSQSFNFYLYNTCYPTKNCWQNCFTAHFYNNIWLGADKLGLLGAIKCFLIGLPWDHNLHVIKTSKTKTQWIEEWQCKSDILQHRKRVSKEKTSTDIFFMNMINFRSVSNDAYSNANWLDN